LVSNQGRPFQFVTSNQRYATTQYNVGTAFIIHAATVADGAVFSGTKTKPFKILFGQLRVLGPDEERNMKLS